ncbi:MULTISPECIES: host attachment protein [Roseovarius]|jgi:protein required for attachment to host cells|uniref:host attachment protein n=1 Tax=Roseovarius TaxID=74030 RepID=UPI000CDD098D|nr:MULTISPECIES: host attachment protein [Roseovarius]
MKRPRIWYIVMNAHRARILRELPGIRDPLPTEITMQGRRRSVGEVKRDRPTRSFASAGGRRRSAVAPGSDPLEEDARNFMRDVQAFLEKEAQIGAFEELVLIAPAETIGLWRAQAPEGLANCVRREIVKNLVRFSGRELVAAIRALVSHE